MVAIFANFQNRPFFEYQLFFNPFYAQNSSNVLVEPLPACFSQFFCLTQTDQFCHFSKSSHFFNSGCFSKPFYSYKTSNVLVEPFLACFPQFYSLTQTDQFCKGYTLCIASIYRILVSFFRILAVFSSRSLHRLAPMRLQTGRVVFRMFLPILRVEHN